MLRLVAGSIALGLLACSPAGAPAPATPPGGTASEAGGLHAAAPAAASPGLALAALPSIDTAAALEHIRTLASDEFEGRAPGTPGEDRTVKYLIDRFGAAGLAPGNPD